MRRKTKAAILGIGLLASIPLVWAATSLGTVQTTINITAPLVIINSVTLDGNQCPVSATSFSCSGNVAEGATSNIVLSLTNPGSISESVSTLTYIPSSCQITPTDVALTLAAGQTTTATVTLAVAASAPIQGCSISTSVVQA